MYTFSAIVIGDGGEVGAEILSELLKNERILKVTLLLHRPLEPGQGPHVPLPQSQLGTKFFQQHVINFHELPDHKDLFLDHDVVFCALGTVHLELERGRGDYYKLDHHFVLDCAKLAKEGGCHHFSVVTMQGANSHSRLFHRKVKGEVEEDLKQIHFYRLTIYRPGLLLGRSGRKDVGWMESVSTALMRKLDIWRMASIEASELAKLMVEQCFSPKVGDVQIFENRMIHLLVKDRESDPISSV